MSDLIQLIEHRIALSDSIMGAEGGRASACGTGLPVLRTEPVPVSAIRRVSLTRLLRPITLRLSVWRGIRRQKIARLIRSEDVKRGLRKSKGERT